MIRFYIISQQRKNQRESDIRFNCGVKLLQADEFLFSYLLGRTSPYCNANPTPLSDDAPMFGSRVLIRAAIVSDSINCERPADYSSHFHHPGAADLLKPKDSAMICHCGKSWSLLRRSIADLLLLERNALKWWKDRCIGYLRAVCTRIDSLAKSDNFVRKSNAIPSRKAPPTAAILNRQLGVSTKIILASLATEISALTDALYSMPTRAGSLPDVFQEYDGRAKALSLEEDGIEEIVCAPGS